MGNAIILAARQVKESIMEMASEMLLVPIDRLEARDRRIYDRENPSKSLEFKEVAARCMAAGKRLIGQGWWAPPRPSLDPETGQGERMVAYYAHGACAAEVAVNVETGEVSVAEVIKGLEGKWNV